MKPDVEIEVDVIS